MKRFKRILKRIILIFLIVAIAVMMVDVIVKMSVSDQIYNSTDNIPNNKVGLLLGTGKILQNGRLNLFYKYRIDAAVELYKSGKIKFILVSGDNSTSYYDEPTTIKKDLVARGIPESKIYLDYAGFRTLDSVVRCHEVFGEDSITVISQKFHNERAIFIAEAKDIYSVGYNARGVGGKNGFKVKIRELFARVKMLMDLVFNKQPKFLGKKIEIK